MRAILPLLLLQSFIGNSQQLTFQGAPPAEIVVRPVAPAILTQSAGKRSREVLAVQVVDAEGRPLEGALVSFRLLPDGPAGKFSDGLTTEIVSTDEEGIANAGRIRWERGIGATRIQIIVAKGDSRREVFLPVQVVAGETGERRLQSGNRRTVWVMAGAAAGSLLAGLGLASR